MITLNKMEGIIHQKVPYQLERRKKLYEIHRYIFKTSNIRENEILLKETMSRRSPLQTLPVSIFNPRFQTRPVSFSRKKIVTEIRSTSENINLHIYRFVT